MTIAPFLYRIYNRVMLKFLLIQSTNVDRLLNDTVCLMRQYSIVLIRINLNIIKFYPQAIGLVPFFSTTEMSHAIQSYMIIYYSAFVKTRNVSTSSILDVFIHIYISLIQFDCCHFTRVL